MTPPSALLLAAALAATLSMAAPAGAATAAVAGPTAAHPEPEAELLTDGTTPAQREADAALLKGVDADEFTAGSFSGPSGMLRYRLLAPPAGAQHPGQRYPLILVLHGSDGVGDDNRGQFGRLARSWAAPAIRAKFPAYILVPQFPERSANYAPSAADGLLAARPGPNIATLTALVEQLKLQYPIATERVYVTGFSMGASAATQAILHQPGLFAAAVAFSGIAPERAEAARLAATPLMLVHGDADTENPIGPDRALFAALRRQPGARVRMVEYQGLEHTVPPAMLLSPAWREWLFAQRLP
ncbi:Phospholipase/Carboxylesterase [Duganella sp. CF517]|uniref:carboxylesterase family protein n=1 Tax=Duganella sp. CF517 TaxID=1881038 RepID=UPI0008C411BE|nr:PHB depolymerase family esterase [Duganella sp. CF517]SEO58471.1 Phospholipase/Carboxylesterase [Duganella sp. CF517]